MPRHFRQLLLLTCVLLLCAGPLLGFTIDYQKIMLSTAKWGYIDTNGKVVIQPQFQEAGKFSEGRAAVKVDGQWGFIGMNGELVAPAKYDKVGEFSDGLAAVQLDKKWGYVNSSGKEVISMQFDGANAFHEGRAVVATAGMYGYINLRGELVIAAQFAYASEFREGLAAVKRDGKVGFIDPAGKEIIAPQFAAAQPFREGLAAVMVEQDKWRFIDKTGKFAFNGEWAYVYSFHDGRALVQPNRNDRYGYIDARGQIVISAKYWHASNYFQEGLAWVEESSDETGLWGFIDTNGQTVFELKHVNGSFKNGLARDQVYQPGEKRPLGSWGFRDRTGTLVIPATFDWAEDFSEGLAPVAVGGDHERVRQAMENAQKSGMGIGLGW